MINNEGRLLQSISKRELIEHGKNEKHETY